jgi:DNA-directed RNA polymerase specialized sigma24 family protein
MFLIVLPDLAVDDPLLDRIRRQEPEAVLAVYEAYFAPLYQYARLRVGDSGLAQDVVSEVFVRLIEVMGTFARLAVSCRPQRDLPRVWQESPIGRIGGVDACDNRK